MPLDTWLTFFVAAWLISLSPGPGAVSCMAAGQRVGYRRALWNIFGLQTGIVLIMLICAAGLGALLAASQTLFMAIKWAGVAYLIWLGVQQWRAPDAPLTPDAKDARDTPGQLFLRAFLINASNPKGIVFMLAVLPQFIDPQLAQWPQYAICAATLVFTDLVVMSGYTLLAARVLSALRDPGHIRWLNRGFGSLFIGAGLLLAGFRRH
ncbi:MULTISPECIES: LysE family transporter [Uliginosibacterium]|uniref:LysE family transporter n=1 Tax=Uliginosibacterium aquaticum TaxID=2731212 RepID=A0ABX2IB30_9RHOO|nr:MULTISPECIES: LysE family transporter [Uliginosibacterium]NSL53599.1 LysE family transporter [Uliginosibacterium aquaticum]PLK49282.1 threonine transporter RhtB [Uliginosibacterium sp. TH139]